MSKPKTLTLALMAALALAGLAAPTQAAPVSVIVELDGPPAAVDAARAARAGSPWSEEQLEARRAELRAEQDDFLARLGAAGVAAAVRTAEIPDWDGAAHAVEYRYTLVFHGLSLVVDDGDLGSLAAVPGVKRVHQNRALRLTLDRRVPYVRAPEVYGDVAEVTPFDDLREGFEGQGIYVAVIDSGIEWSHEMFGADASPPRLGVAPPTAALGSNEKVVYYLPLDGVLDDFGHGTHVASTIAGYQGFAPGPDGVPLTGDDVAIHGVAPQAKILGYKACDAAGTCLRDAILLSIEDAVSPRAVTGFPKPVAHVINMSLGGAGGPDSPTAVASDNAALLGAIVVAAAGNDGPGLRTVGAPAAGRRVIAVAASNDAGVFPNALEVLDGSGTKIPATFAPDSNAAQGFSSPVTGRYVFAGIADTPDKVPLTVLGNVCLVARGSTLEAAGNGTGLFANKALQCELKGAIATVIFNNGPGEIGPVLAPATRPVFTVSGEAGQALLGLGFDAAGVSNVQIRLGLEDPALFEPGIAGFSSRGPVVGEGQVKPDVSAPGVAVLAATTPVGAPAASMVDPTRYIAASGTSMATPHTAGAAALVRQAHPTWSVDEVRAVLANTATNPREADGSPEADGRATDDVLSQGGGLIDVAEAVGARAALGVPGDGIAAPEILAGHVFPKAPAIDSRVAHTESVTVEIRDLSGEGGTYDLRVANNRDLELDGLSATASPAQVTVPAGGSATVRLDVTLDGDAVRDVFAAKVDGSSVTFEPIWIMGYLVAASAGESLRMPFYLKPLRSLPASLGSGGPSITETHEDILPAGDLGSQLVADVTFIDVPVEVEPAAVQAEATLEFINDGIVGLPDLDLYLIDPNGVVIASSTNAGGPESLSAILAEVGTYTYRVVGWANGPTPFTLTHSQLLGPEPPALSAETEWTDASGTAVDFDGDLTLSWQPVGGEVGFELERSTDGGETWEVIAELPADTTEVELTDLPEGEYTFRVRGHHPGQIGVFVTVPSAEVPVLVDRRSRADITNKTGTTVSNVSLSGGVFQLDLTLTNQSDKSYLPLVTFEIVKISSASGTVSVANADNGGGGKKANDPALFDYSSQLGADGVFSPAETTGARTLRFHDPANELFTFRARVRAYKGDGGAGGEEAPSGEEGAAGSGEPTSEPELLDVQWLLEGT
ncbi:MAG TPA: S8 family serine peptidase, partial [Thermoanaerobaculia bacterium]|nr:S8 family serine peptidase [Thermoanaerobaculia bacterium]